VAAQVAALPRLRLAGAEAYENLFPPGSAEQTSGQVDQLLAGLRELVVTLDRRGLFGLAPESQAPEGRAPEGQAPEIRAPEIIVSAGGSMWFDRAAADLAGPWPLSRPVRTVVRAGAYLTHDFDEYERFSPLAGRSDGPPRPGQALEQALELWSAVLSRPEPGLAILNFGKRDAGLDRSLPLPFAARPGGRPAELPAGEYEVLSLNDQHARLRLPVDSPLAVGDLVGCYISHPCTTFDRWRLMPLVTDGYDVIGAVRSYL
jgi:D-serine dehydratase